MTWTQPIDLCGQTVRLRPLQLQDAFQLQPIIDLDFFRYFLNVQPKDSSLESVRDYVKDSLAFPNSQAFVVELRKTGEIIGMTSFMDIRPQHRGLEIGMTWIVPEHRGTSVNPEMKLLLLEQAFEKWLAVRVQLKTDSRNLHSQTAIRKLGAMYEGTLRKHGIQPNGHIRDTVFFSITAEEWPKVKEGLLIRLKDERAKVN
ncbi:MAG: GNAT family N-acetyltransferase [Armatimonadetes bacterium]|nr:GNAT family N-acetyltransferase [Armatimonadota bacterium]